MNNGPVGAGPQKVPNKTLLTTGVMVLVLLALSWPIKKYFFDKPPKASLPEIVDIDPICQSMQKLKLSCVATPMAEGVLGPGHYMDYPTAAKPDTKVTISKGSLFAGACAMQGPKAAAMLADLIAELKGQEQQNSVSFDDITFNLDRAFQAGADLPVPKLADLKLKAGPKLSEVQTISLKVPHAWMKIIDENQFINLLAGAAIDPQCIERVINKEYRVVSTAAIAQDYDIVITEKAGQSFGLSAAVQKGEITMTAGGDASSAIDETIKKNSAIPMVLGVDFFDPEIFKQNRARLTAPIFSTTAQTHMRAHAIGDRGILWQTERSGTLGQTLPLQESGGGQGNQNCGGGAASTATLTSALAPAAQPAEHSDSRSFDLSISGTMEGGLSVNWTNFSCQTQPAHVDALVSFNSVIETIVRSAETSILRVEFQGMPAGRVEVRDWKGNSLQQKSPETAAKDGALSFPLAGAGVYEVQVSGERILSANGPSIVPVNERGTFTVSLR